MEKFKDLRESTKDMLIKAWIDGEGMEAIRNHLSSRMYKYIFNEGERYDELWRYVGRGGYIGMGFSRRDPVIDTEVGGKVTYDLISTSLSSPEQVTSDEDFYSLHDWLKGANAILRLKGAQGLDISEYAIAHNQQREVLTCGVFTLVSVDDMMVEIDGEDRTYKVYTLEYVDDMSEQRRALKGLLRNKLKNNRETDTEENKYDLSRTLDYLELNP